MLNLKIVLMSLCIMLENKIKIPILRKLFVLYLVSVENKAVIIACSSSASESTKGGSD